MKEAVPGFAEHLRGALSVVFVAAFVVALLDALGARGAASIGVGDTIALFVYLGGFYGLLSAPFGAMLGVVSRALPADRTAPAHAWASAFGAFASVVAVGYSTILWTRVLFQNVELAALLAAVTTSVAAAGLGVMATLTAWVARTRGTRIAVGAAWGVGGVVLTTWLVVQNRSGFAQLSVWLLAMAPAIALVGLAAVMLRTRLLRAGWPTLVPIGVVVFCLAAAVAIETSGRATSDVAGGHAPLAHRLAPAVHYVTDFDRDGHSSVMGGGDCAPFDAAIAPGRFDAPGDGVDANCIGGDADASATPAAPQWFDGTERALDVVVVTVETLRADHVGFAGYERPTTPNLDAIAKQAVVFERFYATSTYTRLSLPSLFTARVPTAIDWLAQQGTRYPQIAPANPWLPEAFRGAGYRTASITADFPAFTPVDAIGFDRGFDEYDATAPLIYRGGTMRGFPSETQLGRTKAWIDAREDDERLFMWLHLFEPHYQYERAARAPKFGSGGRIDLYDAEVWVVDDAIGRLVAQLQAAGRWDRTVLVVLGDHGEEFEEHGKKYHGSNLYEPQVRTPLLIRVPGLAGRRVVEPVSFVDVAPTLMNIAGIREGFERFLGRNLWGAMRGEPLADRPIVLEVWEAKSRARYQSAVVNWPYKLIASGGGARNQELYNLSVDPDEKQNLIEAQKDVAATMQKILHSHLDSTELQYR